MTRSKYQFGWLAVVLAMGALACTCGGLGGLGEAAQQMQTAQALATEFDVSTSESGDIVVGDVPDNIPVMDGAENLVSAQGAVSYAVTTDLDTAKSFYQTGMVDKGWQESQDPVEVAGTVVSLNYANDTQQAVISLTAQGAQVQVAIVVSPK